MHILLAGGTGVIGSRLIPALRSAGHTVTATTRRTERLSQLTDLGAYGVLADVYDPAQIADVVAASGADLVLHQLTDLSDGSTDANARLRREGTANLVAAATAAGIDRIIGQSITWIFPEGDTVADESTPIVPGTAVDTMERTMRSMLHATVLRYGLLYGPDTWYARGGKVAQAVGAGMLPATPAVSTFVHIDDVVSATVQSLAWPDGIYHVVDDEPAAGTDWLPVYAAAIEAPEPAQAEIPEGTGVGRAVSNSKARATGWVPKYASWREGFISL